MYSDTPVSPSFFPPEMGNIPDRVDLVGPRVWSMIFICTMYCVSAFVRVKFTVWLFARLKDSDRGDYFKWLYHLTEDFSAAL